MQIEGGQNEDDNVACIMRCNSEFHAYKTICHLNVGTIVVESTHATSCLYNQGCGMRCVQYCEQAVRKLKSSHALDGGMLKMARSRGQMALTSKQYPRQTGPKTVGSDVWSYRLICNGEVVRQSVTVRSLR